MSDDLAARLEALEIRVAYQDQVIEDLNQTITAQWKDIDRLRREMAALADRVAQAERGAGGEAEDEPPPPHY
jgi:SlyX protein